MFRQFENMSFKESREYVEVHPDLAFISLDRVFDAATGTAMAWSLVAVADKEGIDQLMKLFLKMCLSGEMPSLCLEPLGIEIEFKELD